MGTVATSFPPTVELRFDQVSWDGQQASPGRQRQFCGGAGTDATTATEMSGVTTLSFILTERVNVKAATTIS
jgi:hypothetical protein